MNFFRYEFYLDCMTLTGTYDIDDDTWNRMLKEAIRDKRVKETEIIDEVN